MSECLWEIFLAFQHFIALRPILVRLIRQRFQTKHRKKSKSCPLQSTVGQPNNPETLLYLPSILSLQPVMFHLFLLSLLRTWRLSMYWMIPVVIGMSCFYRTRVRSYWECLSLTHSLTNSLCRFGRLSFCSDFEHKVSRFGQDF